MKEYNKSTWVLRQEEEKKNGTGYNKSIKDTIYGGWIKPYRFVMQKYLGRKLKYGEVVHHVNEIKNDDRLENLMLFFNHGDHKRWHKGKRDIKYIYPKEEKE